MVAIAHVLDGVGYPRANLGVLHEPGGLLARLGRAALLPELQLAPRQIDEQVIGLVHMMGGFLAGTQHHLPDADTVVLEQKGRADPMLWVSAAAPACNIMSHGRKPCKPGASRRVLGKRARPLIRAHPPRKPRLEPSQWGARAGAARALMPESRPCG